MIEATKLNGKGHTILIPMLRNSRNRLGLAFVPALALALLGTAAASGVSISSFGATGGQSHIDLAWTTATEMKFWGFNVERSTNQYDWVKITFVQSQSPCTSSVTGFDYSYTDGPSGLVAGTTYYYRLQLLGAQCQDTDAYYQRIVSAKTAGTPPPLPRIYLPMIRSDPLILPRVYLPLVSR